jgi:hypothetical protein
MADWNDQKAVVTPSHQFTSAIMRSTAAGGISRPRLGKNAGDAPHGLNS